MSDSIKYEAPQSKEANITPEHITSSNYGSLIKNIETLKQTQQSYSEDLIELTKLVDTIISIVESESSSTGKEFNSLWRVLKIESLVIGILLGGWIIHVL